MKRKILALATALALALSLSICAFAAENQPPAGSDLALAGQLNQLGLFRGAGTNADGSVNYDLDRQPNRAEGITMLVRALGAGDQEGTAKNHPYTDVPSWANGVVSYAQKKGLTKGVSATKFGAESPVTTAMYLTFMLRALGYQDGTDFFWNTPWDAAVKAGVLPAQTDWTTLTRGEMVRITTAALFAPEAVIELLVLQYMERGRFFIVKRAAAPVAPALARERDVSTDHVDNVVAGEQLVQKAL